MAETRGSTVVARSSATSGGDGQGAARAARDVLGLDAEFGQEAGGLVAVVGGRLHGGDDEALTRARGGDVEQAALLGEQRARGERFGESVAADAVGLQEGAAAAQVRPQALLDAGDDDQAPLQALGAVRGHQAYGVGAYGTPGEGVGGDVLGVDLLQEVQGAPAAGALLRARGGGEQRAHGVEVTVGVAPGRAAAPGGPLQAPGPGCAVPQVPQRLLGRAAAGEALAGLRRAARRGAGHRARTSGSCAASRSGSASARASSSSEGGGSGVARGPLLLAQGPAEAAQIGGVHAGEGGGEEGEGGLGVEPAGVRGRPSESWPRLPCPDVRLGAPRPPPWPPPAAPSAAVPPPVRGAGGGRRRRCRGGRRRR